MSSRAQQSTSLHDHVAYHTLPYMHISLICTSAHQSILSFFLLQSITSRIVQQWTQIPSVGSMPLQESDKRVYCKSLSLIPCHDPHNTFFSFHHCFHTDWISLSVGPFPKPQLYDKKVLKQWALDIPQERSKVQVHQWVLFVYHVTTTFFCLSKICTVWWDLKIYNAMFHNIPSLWL